MDQPGPGDLTPRSQLFTSKLDDELCQTLLSGLKGFKKMKQKTLICCIGFSKQSSVLTLKASFSPPAASHEAAEALAPICENLCERSCWRSLIHLPQPVGKPTTDPIRTRFRTNSRKRVESLRLQPDNPLIWSAFVFGCRIPLIRSPPNIFWNE